MRDRTVGTHFETDFGPYANAVAVAAAVLMLAAGSLLRVAAPR